MYLKAVVRRASKRTVWMIRAETFCIRKRAFLMQLRER
jgi:hypothetical protein